jgi:hypothetical protein
MRECGVYIHPRALPVFYLRGISTKDEPALAEFFGSEAVSFTVTIGSPGFLMNRCQPSSGVWPIALA